MKLTTTMKKAGELAMRKASRKAQELYYETDQVAVYEYEKNDQTMYAYDGCLGSEHDLTFEDLQNRFEWMLDSMQEEGD